MAPSVFVRSPAVSARPWQAYLLIGIGLAFLTAIVLLPLVVVFWEALREGLAAYWQGIQQPEALHAIRLTLLITAVAIPLNTLFGVAIAWVLVRQSFPGQAIVLALLDLPLSISPVVAGFMLILLYSPQIGWLADLVNRWDLKIVFATPGLVLTVMFVTIPFVAREVFPVLQTLSREDEEAAQSLGATTWQTFWRVTLPMIRPALLYGIILSTARAIGEFGAVSVVSGKIIGSTNTLTLHVERVYLEYQATAAFACASLLAIVALLTLVLQYWIQQQPSSAAKNRQH
ncbi:sulfate ABC transporter permease subunit CysW [Synechococcus elongatus]|uniref:Sulfate ABC transporter, permease protein CysW n=2 Tax=Synechococcus elongatus TaxID=32046 RepID=Q31MK1_SYNE7|nr:sulfate ABC transporter permease subunit CysW [Synechococcus elongatus]ABB57718.1 Sulfate ABC transporter, permease protein CysW [Synechococcus elongatus PCC 7942 = FACHB-805]AJD57792.1 Sulfate transport system permease CysW [Synechococcus elongatus UTEX 2973]MBD2586433.1 sulfate ABC transporter permease subunit CysW [Synechococcus elongatus FACHB-242]MBD2687507.1 sulfate ABC transporter permease subunit CysW [Synechococcus elongatus FACHB-1061]MBD2706784.1 sulfate ABC transporter permease 